jgi:DNA-binding ferritin-like protein
MPTFKEFINELSTTPVKVLVHDEMNDTDTEIVGSDDDNEFKLPLPQRFAGHQAKFAGCTASHLCVLASFARAIQLYTHSAHVSVKGQTFIQDHEFLGGVYSAAGDDVDSLFERAIGSGGEGPGHVLAHMKVCAEILRDHCCDTCNGVGVNSILSRAAALISEFVEMISHVRESCDLSDGTDNLLCDIADKYEVTLYKLQQRLALQVLRHVSSLSACQGAHTRYR